MDTHPESPGNRLSSAADDHPDYDASILVVDDEPELSRALSKLLTRNGYHVLTAEDGETGLNTVLNAKPDLVLLDIWMGATPAAEKSATGRPDPMENLQLSKNLDWSRTIRTHLIQ